MRLLAFILIWLSLGIGAVAATTAYVWAMPPKGSEGQFQIGENAEQTPIYAVLAADAGKGEDGAPIATPDTPLTPELVAQLQNAGVKRVRVKSFRISRWTHLPHFVVACVGLLAGAILTRLSAARAVRLAEQAHAEGDTLSPEAALKSLRAVVRALLDDLPNVGGTEQACRTINQRLGDAARDLVPTIVDSRDRLVARMGLGSYAGFMDTFAAGERSLNRAWSAAADGAEEEAVESLERAAERLSVAEARLSGRTPSLLPLA